MKSISTEEIVLILHDIRSMENVGSLFRTADAVGVTAIYLAGITPTPIDRFNRPVGKIAKTALGAEKTIPWKQVADTVSLVSDLQRQGYQVIAIEQGSRAVDYKKVVVRFPVAFILGNEVTGLSDKVLACADVVAEIPMRGSKESLNVSVAGGVALFRILNH